MNEILAILTYLFFSESVKNETKKELFKEFITPIKCIILIDFPLNF